MAHMTETAPQPKPNPQIMLVKWNTPADELVGTVKLVRQLIKGKTVRMRDVRLVVPSANWGVQLERAAAMAGLAVNPNDAEGSLGVPVAHYRSARARESVDHVYLIGCVEGLLTDREAFLAVIRSARVSAVMSLFTRIEEQTAQAAHLAYTRTRCDHGTMLAMVRPAPFIAEWGSKRPTTTGGEALLRQHGLN